MEPGYLRREAAKQPMRPRHSYFRRALAFDEALERANRAEEPQHHLLLVKVQLREPPERIAAEGETAPQRLAPRHRGDAAP